MGLADYNMTLPADTSSTVIWLSSFFGMWLPIAFTCSVSASFTALTKASYVTAFEEESLGGVVGEILSKAGGFGKFLLVVLCLSVTSANTANSESDLRLRYHYHREEGIECGFVH